MKLLRPPPLALYVHFPWCVQKCPYCDFNSYTLHGELPADRYIDALIADLDAQIREVAGRPLVSVFFGGGTPSLFSPASIARLIEAIRARFALAPDLELTLEANPGTIERGRFAEYRAAGVSRVSLGAQSFAAAKLTALGRIHAPDDTRRAAEELHAAGLDNFNLDLMYGLPEQSVAEALADVDAAIALQPRHISHYQLTLEPGTVFAASPPVLPGEEIIEAMLAACQPRLATAQFARYEVSAYATPGRECTHNLNYWQFGDYLGVGAGAHGKVTDTEHGVIRRTQQPRDPRRYLRAGPDGRVSNEVAAVQLPFEFMLNALRCVAGFSTVLFTARTGLAPAAIEPALDKLCRRGLLVCDPSPVRDAHWRATEHGFRFLNEVLLDFLPDGNSSATIVGVPDRPAAAGLSTAVGALRRE